MHLNGRVSENVKGKRDTEWQYNRKRQTCAVRKHNGKGTSYSCR
jgi:hypothetical protein